MPSKRVDRRPRRPKADPIEETADLTVGREDLDGGEDVGVVLGDAGRAFFAPRSIESASPRGQRAAARLQDCTRELRGWQVQLQMAVFDARQEGLSWSAIGWCLGLTGEAARKRFGD